MSPPTPERWVVLDLEGTCWDAAEHPTLAADQRNESETIEIGAVLLSEAMEESASFRTLVRPRRHPQLSSFCLGLTGIGQAQVASAPYFPEALGAFLDWAGGDRGLVLVSWGAWDDRLLRRDAQRWALPAPRWRAFNLKRHFARQAKRAKLPGLTRSKGWMSLKGAIAQLGGQFQGTPHRALDDARNAAWVLQKIRG